MISPFKLILENETWLRNTDALFDLKNKKARLKEKTLRRAS
jgi:hypothetical protein